MSSSLYCDVLKQGSNEKIKTFQHFTWYSRDFFRDETDYRKYYLDFPVFGMDTETRPISGLDNLKQQIPCISFNYTELKNLVAALDNVKQGIKTAYATTKDKGLFDEAYDLIETYTEVKNVHEELNYCLLYCEYELENTDITFKFYIL